MSRTAVIGAGPCGLAQLHAFEQARLDGVDVGEVVCFEKQSDWGGLWNYTWRTGLDSHGDPVHGSMYRYLWSNGPKECLEFSDYPFDEHFGGPIPSFPPREVLYDYIVGRAKKSNVRQFIEFDTAVRQVSFDDATQTFTLAIESWTSGESSFRTETFDYVIVATGHFSVPNVPEYPGFESFPGRILHSHDFRDAVEFAGRDLLILGSSYSAEDIALQSLKYGAASVTIAYRNAPMGFGWPDGIAEVPALQHLDGRTAHFADGSVRDVDAIILCTGYQHHFPFIDPALRLTTTNNLYPGGLYKGVVWTANPKLMYLGMQDQYYTFSMFDAQAFVARDVVLGRLPLPGNDTMAADVAAWLGRYAEVASVMEQIDFQTDYVRDLMTLTDYPAFDLDMVRQHFVTWEHDKDDSITGYRDKSFASPCTGTVGPAPHTTWWDELDDSLARFLKR
ncbi:flavin-containing monooxygenase [Mycolicibacterium vanbaalenii]|uniref:Trimethylamine monooxygenase n=1 Tax=Mycolicibacterium vanbaalenii (strain DSM 7251 / JCM 13017 / BCRC 16820 / KCTC 9966 / NRRL B-24157 / PYR-1) TaxID=350058 RepID=A1T4D6_MYCVP|nr:NAD(P)/FAD-dependent oxidoreductase [Mycolicibacterium vanbaalenii]ABM12036.1 flavin-containing monooxygenase FMO [Mycolicibacterium vanbaalenii PYR-1]MCV7129999.1 NAD(P)/FAD-dependent oxidoreductase [Mycolicibacterium vanbaalenii PYR-1]